MFFSGDMQVGRHFLFFLAVAFTEELFHDTCNHGLLSLVADFGLLCKVLNLSSDQKVQFIHSSPDRDNRLGVFYHW
jgi:hypothetical protein